MHGRKGCSSSERDNEEFNDMIRELELIDLPFYEKSFIRSNKRSSFFCQLDRLLIFLAQDEFPGCTKKALSSQPVLLDARGQTGKATIFRFEIVWM